MFIYRYPFLNLTQSSPKSLKQGCVLKPRWAYQCTGTRNIMVYNIWTMLLGHSSGVVTTAITITPLLLMNITPSQNSIVISAGFTTCFSRNFLRKFISKCEDAWVHYCLSFQKLIIAVCFKQLNFKIFVIAFTH